MLAAYFSPEEKRIGCVILHSIRSERVSLACPRFPSYFILSHSPATTSRATGIPSQVTDPVHQASNG